MKPPEHGDDDEADDATGAFAAAVDWVERFHEVVDEAARPVAEANAGRLRCTRGCASCCVDELTVFPIEAGVIARHHAALLRDGVPQKAGACAFLDGDGACRVYAQRPYVCRTQGLPLRWLEDGPEPVEVRDICTLNAGPPSTTPLEELPPEHCWTIGPFEQRLSARQASVGRADARVPLRSLFEKTAEGGPASHEGRRRLRLL